MLQFKPRIGCEFRDFCCDSAAIFVTFWPRKIYSLRHRLIIDSECFVRFVSSKTVIIVNTVLLRVSIITAVAFIVNCLVLHYYRIFIVYMH